MSGTSRQCAAGCLLLGVTLLLWLLLALFFFRVANVFDAYLMKFPGPGVVFGTMIVFPAAAGVLGLIVLHGGKARVAGAFIAGLGVLLCVAFAVLMVPITLKAVEPKTPRNPGTPYSLPDVSTPLRFARHDK